MLSRVDVAQWSKWNLRNNSKFHFQNTKYHITLSKRTVDEVSFEYSHHKISSLQSKFTTDSLIFPKRGRFHHWREMRQTIHSRLFHVLSNWFKRLASFCPNQSKHRRRVSLATNNKHIKNCKLLQICLALVAETAICATMTATATKTHLKKWIHSLFHT